MGKFVGMVKFIGRTGDIVGSKGKKGSYITRVHQPTVTNPNTTAQRENRVRFLTGTAISQAFTKADPTGLIRSAKSEQITVRNAMTKLLLRTENVITASTSGNETTALVQYGNIQISKGSAQCVGFRTPDTDTPNEITVPFLPNTAQENALVHLIAYCPGDNTAVAAVPVTVSTGTITVNTPAAMGAQNIHLYGFTQEFSNAGEMVRYQSYWNGSSVEAQAELIATTMNSECSPTVYIGSVIPS